MVPLMTGGEGQLLLQLAVVILAAKLGGKAAQRLGQPAVLGELLAGIALAASLLGGPLGMPDFAVTDRAGDWAASADLGAAGTFFQSSAEELRAAEVLGTFAALGLGSGLLANWQFTALILVVLVTTFVAPVALGRMKARFGPESGTATGRRLGETVEP